MYWEKTVEYGFLLNLSRDGRIDQASPLSGCEESGAGDAIFGMDARLILIEFKRRKSDARSEPGKYLDFEKALEKLQGQDKHHLLVYGGDASPLCICQQTYFSGTAVSTKDFDQHCVSTDVFVPYLELLLAFRKQDGRSEGAMTWEAYGAVLGINLKGELVSACSLGTYLEKQGLDHTPIAMEQATPPPPSSQPWKPK